MYPVYLRVENPVYFQRKGGTLFGPGEIDSFRRNTEVIANRYGLEANELTDSINKVARRLPVDAWDLTHKLANLEIWRKVKNPATGKEIYGQLLAEIFNGMGYDGVAVNAQEAFGPRGDFFDRTVGYLFGNRGMKGIRGATHYVVWSPDQIRSAFANSSDVVNKTQGNK